MTSDIPVDFVPAAFEAAEWEDIERLLDDLRDRPVGAAEELEKWLVDRGELAAACEEARANRYIAMSCDTGDEAARTEYLRWLETILPRLKPREFELDRRQVELERRFPLPADRYGVLSRHVAAGVEIFREENVPLETRLDALEQEFDQLAGAMSAVYCGRELTFPQLTAFQESTDRSVREETWRLMADRRLRDAEALDSIFDRMVATRHAVARNAGFTNSIGYTFRSKRRFDYTPEDCARFHDACERIIVPFVRRLDLRRAARLGVDPLRPWDLAVDEGGRTPLQPFQGGADLVRRTHASLESLDPRLAGLFAKLGDGSASGGPQNGAMLDLESRQGKRPGGYQYNRYRSRRPFIFMNAAGMHLDVVILAHEAGHAIHSMVCDDEPLLLYRNCPEEFCEVASMGLEHLVMRHWGAPGAFYSDPVDVRRACAGQLRRSISLLPWIATIDAFQHWLYAHPDHSREERTRMWVELDRRFGRAVDWSGLEHVRDRLWHRQLHLFTHPFYFIEYGIAMVGALQLWLYSMEAGDRAAVDRYLRALSLGGSRPLPELFEAAGVRFDFGPETLERILRRASAELESIDGPLPEPGWQRTGRSGGRLSRDFRDE